MPFLLAVPYLLTEALAFWAVASWIGVGWALAALFGAMFIGGLLAGIELRRIGRLAATERISPGRATGDYGLLVAGGILAGIPGFVTSLLGLLLVFPPTRALIRAGLAVKLKKMVENLGVRAFEVTNARRPHDQYGTFGGFGGFGQPNGADAAGTTGAGPVGDDQVIIDEEEIREWTRDVRPEDFGGEGGERK